GRDISHLLNVKASSVTSALEKLAKKKLVIHERYGYIDLSPEAKKLATNIQKRHNILVKFLTQILDIDPKTANEDACKMEHSISHKTLNKLLKFVEKEKASRIKGRK
ncbi:metal-dependent transcriptional regulator, partial [Candidatus Auribacterota bacterium]